MIEVFEKLKNIHTFIVGSLSFSSLFYGTIIRIFKPAPNTTLNYVVFNCYFLPSELHMFKWNSGLCFRTRLLCRIKTVGGKFLRYMLNWHHQKAERNMSEVKSSETTKTGFPVGKLLLGGIRHRKMSMQWRWHSQMLKCMWWKGLLHIYWVFHSYLCWFLVLLSKSKTLLPFLKVTLVTTSTFAPSFESDCTIRLLWLKYI